jgi:crossover junction endodeoxyribonuclease RusA
MIITLPWPPSVNHYWMRSGNRSYVGRKGIAFRKEVHYRCNQVDVKFEPSARLCVEIDAYPPDRRRRDIDNLLKATLDSLQHAGVYEDDNQIDKLCVDRKELILGQLIVKITEI